MDSIKSHCYRILGVDDGQFARILNFEIPQIKRAFRGNSVTTSVTFDRFSISSRNLR